MARLYFTCVGADEPALQHRYRRVRALECVVFGLLGVGFHLPVVATISQARRVVARVFVTGDSCVVGHIGIGEHLQCLSIICERVGEAKSSVVWVATSTMDFPKRLPPTNASPTSTLSSSLSRPVRTSEPRIVCSHVHAVS